MVAFMALPYKESRAEKEQLKQVIPFHLCPANEVKTKGGYYVSL